MPFRARPPASPVHVVYDGETVVAAKGEPVAASLVAAGRLALARSTKFHRPRGPACMRGACDGCLARVDGEPNVMTCMVAAHEGMTVDSQNTLGNKNLDLLRMTDWFFPQGMNHHELFAGVPGAQGVMQAFARRVAGLGRLPSTELLPRPARRREVDVLVVGGGAAGMAIAGLLAAGGRSVLVVDDAVRPGGGLRALLGARVAWKDIDGPFEAGLSQGSVTLRSSTVAGGVFGDDLLVVGPEGAEVVTARDVVFATGAHDGVGLFEGNDLPGVMSARAAGLLLAEGVVVGKRVVLAAAPAAPAAPAVTEEGGFGEAFARAASGLCEIVRVAEVVRVKGSSGVRSVVTREKGSEKEVRAEALLTDEPRAPAYELCLQAGARLEHRPRGFVVCTEGGRIRDGFWATGEVVGTPLSPVAILEDARRLASALGAAHSSRSAPNIESPPSTATKSNVPSKTR
jgi:sarcosine oxidase subunit alpha